MFSKKEFKRFLEENSLNAKFIKFDFASPEEFHIELKCEVEREQSVEFYDRYVREWIKKFSKFTATTWIVRNVFSKLKRLIFRKIYTCQRSSFNKKKKRTDFETRNQDCKAKIDFRTKFINRNTIKNDRFLKEGLNLTISINFIHTHKVRAPEAYNLLRYNSDIDEVFCEYLKSGCTTTAAKAYHELTLKDKYGDNCPEVFENASLNPSLRHIIYIHSHKRKPVQDYIEIMEEKRAKCASNGIEIEFLYDTNLVLIITPLMKRVISNIGLEQILIDSTDIHPALTVTFILVPTRIGSLPVACVVHSPNSFHQAFALAKKGLEKQSNGVFAPKIVVLSNYEIQSQSIDFDCKKYTSRYPLCTDIWTCLCDVENKVDKKKRHSIMIAAKSFLYAESAEASEKIFSELLDNEVVQSSLQLKEKLTKIWEEREQWMFFEDSNNLRNNLVEMSIRFLKELCGRECKSFTLPLFVDVVVNVLENYYRKIIKSYVKKSKSVEVYTRFLLKEKVVLGFGSEVRRISANEFKIELQQRPKKFVIFRTDTMVCDCPNGKKGYFCEHLTAIVNTIDSEMMQSPILTEEEREVLSKILDGDIEDEVKPEIHEDDSDIEVFDNVEKHSLDGEAEIDENDLDQLDTNSVASSPKVKGPDDYIYLNIKTEKPERLDPLEDESDDDYRDFATEENIQTGFVELTATKTEINSNYETILKAVNDEFRRLNRFFSENPNSSNLETMKLLARELSKIKPVERIDLGNLRLKCNQNGKRKMKQCI